jgi:hypothetical protein
MTGNTEKLRPNNNFLPKFYKYNKDCYDNNKFGVYPQVIYPAINCGTDISTDYESQLQKKQTKRYK